MRHFDQLADSVRDGLFHLAPESFDRDSERQVLANALGATLYVPATKDGLAVTVRRRAAAGTRAMVIDLEDAIADDSVETALSTTNETLRDLNENPPDSLIFVHPTGRVDTKAGYIASLLDHNPYISYEVVEQTIVPLGEAAVVTGELIDSTTCSATHFRFPSITLVSNPCNPPIPLVGYLYDSDEQTSSPPCFNSVTSVGPRVAKRDNTLGTWGLAWSNLRTSGSTGSTVEPVSLALSSRFSSGDVYVGYSDVQNGAARTHLGHGRGATWSTPASIDTLRHHIHVRANDSASSPVGTFRIATNTDGSYDASYRDGVWAGTGALSWSGPATYTSGPPATRPHACWWKRCSAGWQTDVRVFAEEDLAVCFCPSPYLGVEYEQVSPCPSSGPISVPAFPCDKAVLATAVFNSISHGTVTVVDVADAGVIRSLSDRGATVVTPSGDTINVAWRNGKVAWSWDTGISLTGATESDVVFSSSTVNFSVQRNGPIGGFDHGPGVCTGG